MKTVTRAQRDTLAIKMAEYVAARTNLLHDRDVLADHLQKLTGHTVRLPISAPALSFNADQALQVFGFTVSEE